MSTFDSSGGRVSPITRNTGGPLPRIGVTESLAAPGLVAQPVAVDSTVSLANQFLAAIGEAGQLSESISEDARRREIEARRAEADASRSLEGLANQDYRTEFPIIKDKIVRGDITVSADESGDFGTAAKTAAGALIDELVKGKPEAYQAYYREHMTPLIVDALHDQRSAADTLARTEDIKLRGQANVGETDPAKITARVDETVKLYGTKLDHTTALGSMVIPALRSAAKSGNQQAFDAASKALGDAFPSEQLAAEAMLQEAKNKQATEQRRIFNNDIAGAYLDETPLELVRQKILSYRGKIENDHLEAAVREVDSRAKAQLQSTIESRVSTDLKAKKSDIAQRNLSLVRSGLGYTIEPTTITDLRGTEHKLTADAQFNEAMDAAFQSIGEESPSTEVAFARRLELSTANGYAPPQWSKALTAGEMAATESALSKEGEKAAIPRSTVEGYQLYKGVYAGAKHLLPSLANDRTLNFYEVAATLQRDDPTVAGDDTQALLAARRIMSAPPPGISGELSGVKLRSETRKITDSLFASNAKNGGEIGAQIEQLARIYVRAGQLPDKAVESAAKNVGERRITINGWSQPTNNVAIPDQLRAQLPTIAEDILKTYADRFGQQEGVEFDDLTLRVSNTNGFWIIANGSSGLPMPSYGEPVVFSTGDLLRKLDAMQFKKQAESDAETVARQNAGTTSLGASLLPPRHNNESADQYLKRIARPRAGGLD